MLWLVFHAFDKRNNQDSKLRIPNTIWSDRISIVSTDGNDGLHCEDVASVSEDLPSGEEHVRVLAVMRLVGRGVTPLGG